MDDVLDVISTEELFGKPCGADFAVGTVTMPAVYAMQRPAGDDVGDRGRAADELSGLLRPGLDLVGAARACSLILESGGAQRVVDRARSFARRAARAVPLLSPAARELAAMPGAYIDRQLTTKVAPEHRWMLGAVLAGSIPAARCRTCRRSATLGEGHRSAEGVRRAVTGSAQTLLRGGLDQLVRRNLRGVWVQGVLPTGSCVWAANHHSWWDFFVAAAALRDAGRLDVGVLMDAGNIGRPEAVPPGRCDRRRPVADRGDDARGRHGAGRVPRR